MATDVDSANLTYSIVTNGTKGSVVISNAATGAYTYTPNANANGTDTFTFKANDGTADSNTATITVTITAVNDAPTAAAQNVASNEDTAADITLTASDTEGDTLTYTVVDGPTHGMLSSGTGENLTYTAECRQRQRPR